MSEKIKLIKSARKKIFVVGLLIGSCILFSKIVFSETPPTIDSNGAIKEQSGAEANSVIKIYKIKEIVKEIEEIHCKMTREELINQKLTEDDLVKVKEFCNFPTEKKVKILEKEFSKVKEKKCLEGKILNYTNSYNCWYVGYNWGIPNYADLGLSSATCSWHDPNSDCKIEGRVACLWGCNNTDSVLGWHTKWFQSITNLENEILPKGYRRLGDQYGGDYGRSISYGYRWQVHALGGGWWHSEGPEPDPAFNWYAFLRDWWPVEVQVWHTNC